MKHILTCILAILGTFHILQAAEPLDLGSSLPDVSANDESGKKTSLKAIGQKGYLLVYFYPMALTPGCTAQACSLRDSYSELQSKGVTILGVSADPETKLKKFKEEDHLPFSLLSDANHAITDAFGVPTILGKASRQAYLFKDGVLVWRDLKASTSKQAEDVLNYLNSLKP